MRIFVLHTVETLKRAHRVAAPDAAAAESALRASLSAGQRILDAAQPLDHAVDAASAEAAIALLLGVEYLDHKGTARMVEDWVLEARTDLAARPNVNTLLAPMGLRVAEDDRLWIASAGAVPALRLIFKGTQWAEKGLISALAAIDGAIRSQHPLTFAGVRARAVSLPLATVFAVQPSEGVASCQS